MIYKRNLIEVSFIRPILILLVVIYHSTCIHTGQWELPEGCSVIPAYKFVGRLAYAFMLESFVFISGYTWAYLHIELQRTESFVVLFKKKMMRLMFPTIIWGFFYSFFFERGATIFDIIEGPGHLWFLPMLFECFLISWCILRLRIPFRIALPILFLIAIIRSDHFPLRLNYTLYYLFFFILGYFVYSFIHKTKFVIKKYYIILGWPLFFISYFSLVVVRAWIISNIHIPILLGIGKSFCMIIYSLIGTLTLIASSIYITNEVKLWNGYVGLGNLCMGVYIFQQFILEIVYYHSAIPLQVPNWLLPLLGFVFALAVSLVLTYLIRSTKLGKSVL